MNKIDKLCKDAKIVVDSVKDMLDTNFVSAFQEKKLEVSQEVLEQILQLVSVSVNEGFQRALSTFSRAVKETTEKS
jgi:hypothetical protein